MTGAFAYSGSAISAIDDKGRLSIPAFLRKDLIVSSGGRTICVGLHEQWDCLVACGLSRKADMLSEIQAEWEAAVVRGEKFDRKAEGARRFSSLKDVSFDASGRFQLPPELEAVSGFKGQVYCLGTGVDFCLWDPQALLETTHDVPVDKRIVEFEINKMAKKK